jgi:hypothetical protein
MFRQILVAIIGAVAAQLTAATLTLTPSVGSDREAYEAPRAAIRLAIVPGSTGDLFATPIQVSSLTPFLGASQISNGN